MTDFVKGESHAIEIATKFLNGALPNGVPPSHIKARHVANEELASKQNELREFCMQSGEINVQVIEQKLHQFGLLSNHWSVGFYVVDEPSTASTTPPTIVRVYDADGRAELGN